MCRTIQNNLLTASQFPMGSFANFNTHISIQLCTFHHTYSYPVIFAPISHHSDLPKNKEISMVSNASTHNTASQAHNIKTKRRRTKLVFALGYGISVFLGIRSSDCLNEYRMRNRILPTMPRSDIAIWFLLAHHRTHPHTKAAYLQSVRQSVQQQCQSCKSAIPRRRPWNCPLHFNLQHSLMWQNMWQLWDEKKPYGIRLKRTLFNCSCGRLCGKIKGWRIMVCTERSAFRKNIQKKNSPSIKS